MWFLSTSFLRVFVLCLLIVYFPNIFMLSLRLALQLLCQNLKNKEINYFIDIIITYEIKLCYKTTETHSKLKNSNP